MQAQGFVARGVYCYVCGAALFVGTRGGGGGAEGAEHKRGTLEGTVQRRLDGSRSCFFCFKLE